MAGKAKRLLPFNDQAVAKVARTKVDRQTEWKIADAPGLTMVVKPSGMATFYVRYQIGKGDERELRREALGLAKPTDQRARISLHDARTKALAIATEVAHGFDPVAKAADAKTKAAAEKAEAEAKAKAPTFRQLFEDRVSKDDKRSERTLDDYRQVLEAHVFDKFGDVPAHEVTTDQIAAVLEEIEDHSKHRAHKARSAIGSTYRWALSRRKVKVNPAKGLGFTHQSKPRNRVLNDDELGKLWRTLHSDALSVSEGVRTILRLAVLTGQRNSEVAGAMKSELRLEGANPQWRIPSERMKARNREQIVPLSEQADALFSRALELAREESVYAFPGTTHGRRGGTRRAEHIAQETVSRAMKKARELAGVSDAWVHDLRRCVTTWLREHRHVSSDICDLILHHSRKGVTASHYDFSTLEGPVRRALQEWADHVEAVSRKADAGKVAKIRA
jgi:integrase